VLKKGGVTLKKKKKGRVGRIKDIKGFLKLLEDIVETKIVYKRQKKR